MPVGYWPSRWPGEDGGPRREQAPSEPTPGLGLALGLGLTSAVGRPALPLTSLQVTSLEVTSRLSIASTMVVLRDPGEVYLLCHTAGDEAVSWVEQLHPHTLEVVRRSPDLAGGPTWPGGIACHANGSIYVVFGRHAHRLSPELELLATEQLPRLRRYNSFVILPSGHLATKDFGGLRANQTEPDSLGSSELLVLEPTGLKVVATCQLPEPSIARLSADGDDIYVVGDTSVQRVRWTGVALVLDPSFRSVYRTLPGQTYGWDAVISAGAAWFLDNGFGSNRYAGTFRGIGVNEAPLHLVRVSLATGAVTLTEVCGLSGGVIANPPAIDPERRIAVAYDSGNGVVAAFRFDDEGVTSPLWQMQLDHAAHPLRFPQSGELLLCHYDVERNADQAVVVSIETGAELARIDYGSPIQSVLFAAAGFEHDVYLCSFSTVARLFTSPSGDDHS